MNFLRFKGQIVEFYTELGPWSAESVQEIAPNLAKYSP